MSRRWGGFVVLLAVTASIEIPAKFSHSTTNDPWRYFAIGTAFNLLRILALGVVVGHLAKRRNYSDHLGR